MAPNDVHLDTNEAQFCLNTVEEYKEKTGSALAWQQRE